MEAAALRLSPRLRAVAEAVPPGSRVADVGTDHALLLAWLVTHGRASAGIGIDVNAGPLEQARRTLAAAGVGVGVTSMGAEGIGAASMGAAGAGTASMGAGVGTVELRQGDGLGPLAPGEVDVVVLAGMGGARMVRLLEEGLAVVEGLRALVLQPNTDWARVRRWVMEGGFGLAGEAMVEDRGKFYVVLDVRPGQAREGAPAWSEDELELGPRLLAERPLAFVAWLRHELRRTERAAAGSEHGTAPAGGSRLDALRQRAERLRRGLDAVR